LAPYARNDCRAPVALQRFAMAQVSSAVIFQVHPSVQH
jgi:hypothetical protein